ncbi:type II and III secretion system protein family protein [Amaricoccus sp.]|uniref:type II and III secretion system protein family protein n=1 Tax=Amaricoccus sp. TaxID=1872485 RepID=UPI00260AA068|nr:type II and III secretion system protein family protein [Amaricoccus sp.]HRO11265.1 type II and III secretion system protein family protein [Amaricoccus sp.]
MYRHRPLAVALAATIALLPAGWPVALGAFELVQPQNEQSVSLVVGTGQLIRVDEAFSSLFVANPEVADVEVKSPRLMYLTGVGVGETTLFAVDDGDNVLMSTRVRVTHNLAALADGISAMAPGQSVKASTVDQSLVLTGTVKDAEQAANILQVANQFVDDPTRVVNRLNVAAPTQVNLQVRIAEVARNVDRQLGIQWNDVSLGINGGRIGFNGGRAVQGDYQASYGATRGSFNIDVVLQALQEEGLVTIMAEPNLTARSGEPATFLAGGEYPYSTVSDNGTNVEFKNYGIGLNFTPTVIDGNRISLTVGTEVSELNFAQSETVPSLRTRRAETTVDLASGQSFAIAGLMENSSSQNASRVPALGTMPVLGALFRSQAFQRGQTELVIIVTPVIVNPTTGKKVRTPVDNFVPPNDFERILLGRFQGNPRGREAVQNGIGQRRLVGPSGFVFQ